MKKIPGLFMPLVCLALTFVYSCDTPATKKEKEIEKILGHFPYAPITDSIRQAPPAQQAALYFRRAELLARNDLHELAALDFNRSWKLQPDETTGFRYASTLSIIGHTGEAISLLEDCHRRYPANTGFTGSLAELYTQNGQPDKAMRLYDERLKTDSSDFEAWYEKGLILEKARDTVRAIEALQKASELQPVTTYLLELAHLYAENRNKLCLGICDQVIARDSSHTLLDPLFIKGIYYSNMAQYKKAVIQFDSCIDRDWKFTDAHLEKGIAIFKQKDYPEALQAFEMTVKVSDTYPDGYFWLGRCYEALGKKEEAIRNYRAALALDKDFSEAAERIKNLQ
jgi:tetratricopeptide (TPR) repeat protein